MSRKKTSGSSIYWAEWDRRTEFGIPTSTVLVAEAAERPTWFRPWGWFWKRKTKYFTRYRTGTSIFWDAEEE